MESRGVDRGKETDRRMNEIMLLLSGCGVVLLGVSSGQQATPSEPRPRLVAHRGASEDAPENTLAAFRMGFEQGAEAIEGDFRLTRDGHIVAMHDPDLARTTGDPRMVDQVALRERRTLDAGSWGRWKDRGFEGIGIPTLAEVLGIVPPGRGIFIEVKDGPRMVDRLVREIEAADLGPDRITVISFDAPFVAAYKRAAPKHRAMWLTSFTKNEAGHWRPGIREILETARRIDADGIDVRANPQVVDEEFVRAVREAGLELHVWTVNDVETARRLRELGVDSITTDRPGRLRREM